MIHPWQIRQKGKHDGAKTWQEDMAQKTSKNKCSNLMPLKGAFNFLTGAAFGWTPQGGASEKDIARQNQRWTMHPSGVLRACLLAAVGPVAS